MSNAYFQFKQFRVAQDRCAMKVSTDACIQGAWTPLTARDLRVLDIGAGTGLLSLMIAQRQPDAIVDSLELDTNAAAQAAENVAQSPFATRIHVIRTDARIFIPDAAYDLIICNPPFFKNSLKGPDAERNRARHNISLQQEDLIEIAGAVLGPDGRISVLWPVPEMEQWKALSASKDWSCCAELLVKDKDASMPHRIIGVFSRNAAGAIKEELIIKDESGKYSPRFSALLSPFYLQL